jgi:pyruvate kinase
MTEAKIIAKIENMEGLVNYREIMEQCDVMLLSRGSMGNCVDPEKMFLAQKMLLRVRPAGTAAACQQWLCKNM